MLVTLTWLKAKIAISRQWRSKGAPPLDPRRGVRPLDPAYPPALAVSWELYPLKKVAKHQNFSPQWSTIWHFLINIVLTSKRFPYRWSPWNWRPSSSELHFCYMFKIHCFARLRGGPDEHMCFYTKDWILITESNLSKPFDIIHVHWIASCKTFPNSRVFLKC